MKFFSLLTIYIVNILLWNNGHPYHLNKTIKSFNIPDTNINARQKFFQSIYSVDDGNVQSKNIPAVIEITTDREDRTDLVKICTTDQVGSIWGVSYDNTIGKIFISAFAKRHSSFGPLGSGGIYSINYSGGFNTVKPLVDFDQIGISTRNNNLNRFIDVQNGMSHDSLMFSMVGKVSLGGLDISEDGKSLYTMNLYNRKLYKVNLNSASDSLTIDNVKAYTFPSLENSRGYFRPFAVKWYKGKVYVGAVWDASISQDINDLKASVFSLDSQDSLSQLKEVFSFSLNYMRGKIGYNISKWRPWIDDYNKALVPNSGNWMIYPQPILADIEFDTDGSMIIGLMDRLGHQTGDGQLFRPKGSKTLETYRGLSGGDVLRVAYRNGYYELERNAKAGNLRTAGRDNGQGPAGGEFYNDDQFTADGITWHQETATGGLAVLPGTDEVIVSAREPVPGQYLTGGVKWLSNKTGKATRGLSVFPADARAGYFWKTNNVGDIELITEPAPIEVGDRVWHDQNGNGLQDTDEPGLADIEVQLYQQNKLLATVKTNSEGYYHFKDGDVMDGIKPKNSYTIRIPLKQIGYAKLQVPVLRNTAKQQPGTLPTDIDNDAQAIGDTAVINLTTGYAGQSIHNLDAGLQLATAIETQAARLQISPNPATTQTELTYRGYQVNGAVTLQVRDAAGRLLQTQTGELKEGYFHQTIPVNQLIGGTYFISITEDSHSTSAPLVKP